MLTDKCKMAFLDWFVSNYIIKDLKYSDLTIYQKGDVAQMLRFPIVEHAFYVAFFDSVGLYVSFEYSVQIGITFWRSKICNVCYDDLEYKVSRTEATVSAFKKANEIYNNK